MRHTIRSQRYGVMALACGFALGGAVTHAVAGALLLNSPTFTPGLGGYVVKGAGSTGSFTVFATTGVANSGLTFGQPSKIHPNASDLNQHGVVYGPNTPLIDLAHVVPDIFDRNQSLPQSMSPNGQYIAGTDAEISTSGVRIVRWDANTGAVTTLSTGSAITIRVNDSGVVIAGGTRYAADGTPTGLLSPNGGANALSINNAGTIAGTGNNVSGVLRWDANSATPTVLGNLGTASTGTTTIPFRVEINNAGTIIGNLTKYTGGTSQGSYPVRYDPNSTTPVELDSFGLTGTNGASAQLINDNGLIVGTAFFPTTGRRIAVWQPGSTVGTLLTQLSNPDTPYAVNNSGIIVGNTEEFIGASQAVGKAALWRASDGSAVLLDTLLPANSGWALKRATDISDTGFISGYGLFDPDGVGGQVAYRRLFTMLVPDAGTYGNGDADFNTTVDFNDLLVLAKHYNQASNGSTNAADFDLNGITDFNDLLTIAKHYSTSATGLAELTSAAFAADFALAQSLVPEPTTAGCLGLIAAGWVRRHRRTR